MKILYGVNGVGNGHITRSRIMARKLKAAGHEVTYLFSGRDKYFDMEDFLPNIIYKKGLRFHIEGGRVKMWKTIQNNDMSTFLRDIDDLDLSLYDLVISDYEPITAWAAKIQDKFSIGIGHQYSFDYDIPKAKNNFFLDYFMKMYAPVSHGIGLHWDSFGYPILLPIVDELTSLGNDGSVLVYLAFEEPTEVLKILALFPTVKFKVYGFNDEYHASNIELKVASKDGFLNDLMHCDAVICNTGFELISEAISIGKRVLTKPLTGQMEQQSNRKALDELGYATTTDSIDYFTLRDFLSSKANAIEIRWPDTAELIVDKINSKFWT